MRTRHLLCAELLVPLMDLKTAGSRWFRQTRPADPIAELTERLRHPVRWRLTHPVQAIRRTARRH